MAMASYLSLLPLLLLLVSIGATRPWEPEIRLPNEQQQQEEEEEEEEAKVGTRWAVLVAGSKSWDNYRHQADVCHAYQVLKKGGLKEENIVVFMYNDIASNPANPNPGTIINHPNGTDVYAGVPKDYTGEHATAANLYAVLLGDKSALKGGSGKVVDSKPHDSIFFFFSDHGGPGVLGMPSGPSIYATDFIDTLKKKHAAKGFREMVMYIEACESGSVFEGIMPNDINVYVTTASNAQESSYGTYCPGMEPSPPPQYHTCLGDLYSVAWIEDSETHNLKRETIKQQFNTVKDRTSKLNGVALGSHVMEYGDTSIKKEKLYLYLGFNPASVNYPPNKLDPAPTSAVNQRDADLVYLWHKYTKSEEGSEEKMEILKEIREKTRHRGHVDESVKLMGLILYGPQIGSSLLESVRPRGLTLVDDWECLKSTVRTFEKHCGLLTQYGMKHMRAFANICNSGVSRESVEEAAMAACATYHNSNYGNTNGVFTFTA